ncbi:MAG TPA: alpha-amylase family glycosyl hydrolase [Puia sp.]|nr:alpha-amylase family glycosyl hydrolase [Puia sp.]
MNQPNYPTLYQVNTRVWITELSQLLQRKATLDDIPDKALDQFAEMGFNWIWFLSVWRTGETAKKISRQNRDWRREFEATLPDLCDEDIGGSGFAVADYTVHPDLGGEASLARLRARLRKRGLKLMLDFVPNHMAPDHCWIEEHPDYFVLGTQSDLEKYPQNYTLVKREKGDLILAYGRDPYFAGWPDTIQLDYSNLETCEAMIKELLRISAQCDGVRCDMSMLVQPEVFEKTWGRKAHPFWSKAIRIIREQIPDFCFMAEVYWNMEWELQQEGFDYTYDKRLYDRLREGHTKSVREHFFAEMDYQVKLARFLENHDEPRAASTFETDKHKAAAVIAFLSPGLRFFHQGQFEGRKKKISPHLIRAPKEPVDEELQKFYSSLLAAIKKPLFRNGYWQLLECFSAWEGNETWDSFIAFAWEDTNGRLSLVCVNYAPHSSQCYVRLPFSELTDKSVRLRDLMSAVIYDRQGNEVLSRGMYFDLPSWGYHIFDITVPVKTISHESATMVVTTA